MRSLISESFMKIRPGKIHHGPKNHLEIVKNVFSRWFFGQWRIFSGRIFTKLSEINERMYEYVQVAGFRVSLTWPFSTGRIYSE